jgi:hypothetical protein
MQVAGRENRMSNPDSILARMLTGCLPKAHRGHLFSPRPKPFVQLKQCGAAREIRPPSGMWLEFAVRSHPSMTEGRLNNWPEIRGYSNPIIPNPVLTFRLRIWGSEVRILPGATTDPGTSCIQQIVTSGRSNATGNSQQMHGALTTGFIAPCLPTKTARQARRFPDSRAEPRQWRAAL